MIQINYLTKNSINRQNLLREIIALNFPRALKTVLDEYEITKEIVEDDFNISYRTIERYMYTESQPVRNSLIQLLIEIGLPFEVSQVLLAKAGFRLRIQETPYIIFLEQEGKISIHECNTVLREYNSIVPKDEQLKLFTEKTHI